MSTEQPPAAPREEYYALLRASRTFLAYQQRLGVETLPTTPAARALLTPTKPARPTDSRPKPTVTVKPAIAVARPPQSPRPAPGVSINNVREELGNCTRCRLHAARSHLVFGEGAERPVLMVVGDWPGPADDQAGQPFRGPEGEMLTKMLQAIQLQREQVYVTNLIKCRPPGDRPPTREEIAACLPFLFRQIEITAPRVICAMGPLVTQTLLATEQKLIRLRGKFHDCLGVPLMPTFHPRFLLENPEMKKATWQDLLMIQKKCGG